MRTITITDNNFDKVLEILAINEEDNSAIRDTVSGIIKRVKSEGNPALLELTNKFDRNQFALEQIRVTEEEINNAYNNLDPALIKALELSSVRIHGYYERLKPENLDYTDSSGVRLGARYVPIDSVGIYVPGGKASYPSSVLMNAVPAKVAGVKKIVMVCPAPDGEINPVVIAAAKVCGVTEIYKVGGAQAVAALAHGTTIIPKVDKIVGPGNAYVAEAKRQVFGLVGIDMIAGPSEILVIADENNNPDWIAADLLSQAEHDETARPILVTTSQSFAQKVVSSVYDLLQGLNRKNIATKSVETQGLVVVVKDLDAAAELSNLIAPEHLELAVDKPDALMEKITNAGAVFLGKYTPEAIGDYIAGPSHVLPTSGSARFSAGLGVSDFLKRQSIIGCTKKSFDDLAEPTMLLAEHEGLGAHKLSISIRHGK
jgi:histidinol dehydrogenase